MRGVRPQNSINDTREDHLRIEMSYFDDEDRFDSELNSVYAHESEDENESIVENYYMSELADENWGKSAGLTVCPRRPTRPSERTSSLIRHKERLVDKGGMDPLSGIRTENKHQQKGQGSEKMFAYSEKNLNDVQKQRADCSERKCSYQRPVLSSDNEGRFESEFISVFTHESKHNIGNSYLSDLTDATYNATELRPIARSTGICAKASPRQTTRSNARTSTLPGQPLPAMRHLEAKTGCFSAPSSTVKLRTIIGTEKIKSERDKRPEKLLIDHLEQELSRMQDHQDRSSFASIDFDAKMTTKREQWFANWSWTMGSWIYKWIPKFLKCEKTTVASKESTDARWRVGAWVDIIGGKHRGRVGQLRLSRQNQVISSRDMVNLYVDLGNQGRLATRIPLAHCRIVAERDVPLLARRRVADKGSSTVYQTSI